MRDSALKHVDPGQSGVQLPGRRRAHARQRFETDPCEQESPLRVLVGEELMRDSALKRVGPLLARPPERVGEELMRDSALKLSSAARAASRATSSEKSSCATAL